MKVLVISLTDDPLDPPGADRYGGAQSFMFDFGRYLVRTGNEVTFFTRKSRSHKPDFQQLGPQCQIIRLQVGPDLELSHHDLWSWQHEILDQAARLLQPLGAFDAVFSYNWISGLVALGTMIKPHLHHILSLGRVRKQLGEESHPSDSSRDQGETRVFREATRLICVCEDELSALKQLYPEIDPTKAVILPYPVDSDAYSRRPFDPDLFLRWKAKRFEEGP